MKKAVRWAGSWLLILAWVVSWQNSARAQSAAVHQLVGAIMQDTPLEEDLESLTDEIGGRATGSEANLHSVEWALARFRDAGVAAQKEAFTMPVLWLEKHSEAHISGDATFSPRVVAMPFSTATPAGGITARLVDGGEGSAEDFKRLGSAAMGAFVLIETHELHDLDGLFREYNEAVGIEKRAFEAGVAGVIYMSSRPKNLLYRHNASKGPENTHPMLVMEREGAKRAMRLLRRGKQLQVTVKIDIRSGSAYTSYNVIGEIKGSEKPDEIVLIGAHLDSWDLGTGALDNGCNVAMMIDIARQIKKLGLRPRRTMRFALFNGEEQGMMGSWAYTQKHEKEMDQHVMAASFDIGSGRITGFFTNGRADILPAVEKALEPVKGLGPFTQINEPLVGTDNLDFMLQGVANLVANQASANYGPNYHARSDTYDKVDLHQLRLNEAIAAAVAFGFANMQVNWRRQSRAEIENLVRTTTLGEQMRSFGIWQSWEKGQRGRQPTN